LNNVSGPKISMQYGRPRAVVLYKSAQRILYYVLQVRPMQYMSILVQ